MEQDHDVPGDALQPSSGSSSPRSNTPVAPSKPWVTSAVLSTARAHGRAISFTVTTVQRVRTPEGKEHLQDGGLPVQKGGSLASPHLPAQPVHEMRCSSVLEKCEVKGHEHAVQACCDRPHMCLVTSSYEPTLETKTFIEKSSSIAHTSACVKENFKRADSHRAPW